MDYAIEKINSINEYLCQDVDSRYTFDEELEMLEALF